MTAEADAGGLPKPERELAVPPVLARAVGVLAQLYTPEAIYLFGSEARGDATVDSDYDLLLVVDDSAVGERRRADLAYRALRVLGRAFDVVIWRRSAFLEQLASRTSLPSTVASEGVLLYAS